MKARYIEYGGKLALVCALCMLGVGGAYVAARSKIEVGKKAAFFGALSAVLRTDDSEPTPPMSALEERGGYFVYKTPEGEERYAAQGSHPGYSGPIEVAVGARKVDGVLSIIKVRVITQTETPGLGTRTAEQSSNLTLWTKIGSALGAETVEVKPFPFLDQYEGKSAGQLLLTGDPAEAAMKIVRITGVSISCNAATEAVKKGLAKIEKGLR